MNEREQLISAINGSTEVVSKLGELEDKIEATEEKIRKWKPRIWMTLLAAFGVLCIFGGIDEFKKGHPSAAGDFWVGVVIIAVYAYHMFYAAKKKKLLSSLNEEYEKVLNDPSISWVPVDYRNAGCILKIAEYVRNNRADTLRDCINMLETEMHQNRVEQAALVGALYAKEAREEARAARWRW